ncbi:hypothetical protein DOTSEDRAFT_55053 [Dothistroma septosporum NZE10]|uniref:Uncharacterized protein n=1 Tax=Dothistroma septosporum (strain NZE10 / CBS 128990) TaxID=675120 RepID=N1PFK2_DOTSN|nr:hypothetical protein DOTSEDRAFT_55053 [Dothistroma septosporum NZE10]
MKTDNYLSLCLEQAAKSPLHYRHGAIVVRGGKVIGHGYNDYKPGFNGGSLKHGKIAKGTFDGDAVKQLKDKLKKKNQQQQDIYQPQRQQSCVSFVQFEAQNGTGGGHSVNQPLSMHSEMMAIYSALSASSTLSSTTFAREKPCFKLPRSDKRKARLQRDVLMAYVAAVKQELNHNNKELEYDNDNDNNKEHEDKDVEAARLSLNKSLAFHVENSGQKHHHHQNRSQSGKEKKKGKKKENRYGYQYQYQYGSQTQHEQPQPSASRSSKKSGDERPKRDVTRDYDATITNHDDNDDAETTTDFIPGHPAVKRKKDYKRSGKMRSGSVANERPADEQPLLLPSGHAGGHSVADRRKHHRLKGADLYVTRLGWNGKPASKPKRKPVVPSSTQAPEDSLADSVSSLSSISATSSHSTTGSLHDELTNREPSPSHANPDVSANQCDFDRSTIHASRPCYRCITFMYSVGIRRVFWTNDAGEWQGGKVADLVDSMDGAMENVADGGPMGNGVFVTKHEVLMLRRMMGANISSVHKRDRVTDAQTFNDWLTIPEALAYTRNILRRTLIAPVQLSTGLDFSSHDHDFKLSVLLINVYALRKLVKCGREHLLTGRILQPVNKCLNLGRKLGSLKKHPTSSESPLLDQGEELPVLYEIYIARLHLDFFFILGFWVQLMAEGCGASLILGK